MSNEENTSNTFVVKRYPIGIKRYYTLEDNKGEIIANATCYPATNKGETYFWLDSIEVCPTRRTQKIGTWLLQAVRQDCAGYALRGSMMSFGEEPVSLVILQRFYHHCGALIDGYKFLFPAWKVDQESEE